MDPLIREVTVDDAEGLGVAHVAAWQAAYPGLIPDDYLASLDPGSRGDGWRTAIEIDDQFDPPRKELRCSAALQTEGA